MKTIKYIYILMLGLIIYKYPFAYLKFIFVTRASNQ